MPKELTYDEIMAGAKKALSSYDQFNKSNDAQVAREGTYRKMAENPEHTYGEVAQNTAQGAALPASFLGGPVGAAAGGYYAYQGIKDLIQKPSLMNAAIAGLSVLPGVGMAKRGLGAIRGISEAANVAREGKAVLAAKEALEAENAYMPRDGEGPNDIVQRYMHNAPAVDNGVPKGSMIPKGPSGIAYGEPDNLIMEHRPINPGGFEYVPGERNPGWAGENINHKPIGLSNADMLNTHEFPSVESIDPESRAAYEALTGDKGLDSMLAGEKPLGNLHQSTPQSAIREGRGPMDVPIKGGMQVPGAVRGATAPMDALDEIVDQTGRGVQRKFVERGGKASATQAIASGDQQSIANVVNKGITRKFVAPAPTKTAASAAIKAGDETSRRAAMFGGVGSSARLPRPVYDEKALAELIRRLRGGV